MSRTEVTELKTAIKRSRREREVTSKVARFVNAQIEFLRGQKSQVEIAQEAGYAKPNIIIMFKTGDTRLPLSNIHKIAKALEVDPVRLTRLALQEYEPEVWSSISETLGEPVTANERKLIERFREFTKGEDFELAYPNEIEALKNLVEVMKKNRPTTPATRHVM